MFLPPVPEGGDSVGVCWCLLLHLVCVSVGGGASGRRTKLEVGEVEWNCRNGVEVLDNDTCVPCLSLWPNSCANNVGALEGIPHCCWFICSLVFLLSPRFLLLLPYYPFSLFFTFFLFVLPFLQLSLLFFFFSFPFLC